MGTHPIFESDFDCLTAMSEANDENNEGAMPNELQAQEAQLRSRYGNIDKRKGNAMLMKKLQGKNKQYFDSGDYNMAKNKTKGPAVPNPLAKKTPTPVPIQIPDELPQAVRRQSNAVEIQPQNVAALQQRRGSQSTLANVSH